MTKLSALLLILAVLGWLLARLYTSANEGTILVDDFVQYWAAGRLLLQGENPYDYDKMFALQQAVGWSDDKPVMMWNPSFVLTIAAPFSTLSYPAARMLWLLFQGVIVFICADQLWRLYGGPTRYRIAALALSVAFPPVIFVLRAGQVSPLILLGAVVFLVATRYQRWWIAGAALPLLAIKPHLIHLFWPALVLWSLEQRRWQVFVSGGLVGVLLMAFPLAADSSLIHQYREALATSPLRPEEWASPTIGAWLRLLIDLDRFWLQFIPQLLAVLLLVIYWFRIPRPQGWDWSRQMPLLLLCSVVTAPYGWTYDYVVLLPAVICFILHQWRRRDNRTIRLLAFYLLWCAGLFLLRLAQVDEFWRVAFAPSLLLIYVLGTVHDVARPTVTRNLPFYPTS